MKKIKKNTARAILLAGALGLAAAGSASAYLTDFDKAENPFTVGQVKIQLQEPGWNPDDHKTMEPGKEIRKDPQIKNTGTNDAFVYLEVSIPMKDVTAADYEGRRMEQKLQELFTFQAGEKWFRLDARQKDSSMVYVYAYNQVLKPEQTTEKLFDSVRFLNVIEGQLDGQQLNIPVRAYAIQTAYTGGEGETVQDQAREAYRRYVNQNAGQEGQTAI